MSGESWNQPVWINEQGTRAVVEANWDTSERCQIILDLMPGEFVRFSTCMEGMKPILLNFEHLRGLAYFFRSLTER